MNKHTKRPRPGSLPLTGAFVSAVLCAGLTALAHDRDEPGRVVIDTDLGMDDVVAVSMALQSPDCNLAALVASEGVADAAAAPDHLARLADFFNRGDLSLFAGFANPAVNAPPWRLRVFTAIESALPSASGLPIGPAAPGAYAIGNSPSTVVVLGPLTNLARALTIEPDFAKGLARVVVAGDPESDTDWNLSTDRAALEVVRSADVPVVFVRPTDRSGKPGDWYTGHLSGGQRTSLGETLLDRLLAIPDARDHYLGRPFFDELAVLYVLHPNLFTEVRPGIVEPADARAAAEAIAAVISFGRQHKDRVVFSDTPLPDSALQADVRARREAILTKNGSDEWFAQLLLNELHEHLGAYSIIGVKMGLRAAELLNAPQHAMHITSAAPADQPLSCLNDGLLVSTGSTPGRNLFRHVPGPPGAVEAAFSYNGRTLTLRLKPEYRERIRSTIRDLLDHLTLEDQAYWDGVRALGLTIWQDWHRRDLFEISPATDTTPPKGNSS